MKGVTEYERDMLKKSTIADIRSKISDKHTLNVSAYDPSGLESLDTYVKHGVRLKISPELTSLLAPVHLTLQQLIIRAWQSQLSPPLTHYSAAGCLCLRRVSL